jgi:hypothetical protein
METNPHQRGPGPLEMPHAAARAFLGWFFRNGFGTAGAVRISFEIYFGESAGFFNSQVADQDADGIGRIVVPAVKRHGVCGIEVFHIRSPSDGRIAIRVGGVSGGIQIEPCGTGRIVDIAEGPLSLDHLFFDIEFAPGRLEDLFTDDREPLLEHV